CFASSLVPVSASSLYHLFCSLRSLVCLLLRQHPPRSALFPYTTLFRSLCRACPPRSASSVPTEPSSTPIRPSTRPTPTVPPTHRPPTKPPHWRSCANRSRPPPSSTSVVATVRNPCSWA